MPEPSSIANFFHERKIFVTGATGFLGKVLVSKLLRSCKGIDIIYVLIRQKRNKDATDRFRDFLEDADVDKDSLNKIHLIIGDISKDGLGLKEEEWNMLTESVSVIFHSAATVRFTEPLKDAIGLNVKGTDEVKKLAMKCKNIVSVVFVGTAFSQFPMKRVNEVFYEPPMHPERALQLAEEETREKLEGLTKDLLGNRPNTYTYTKAISEEIVRSCEGSIPCCLFRPAVVSSAVSEPSKGWICKGNAVAMLTTGIMSGFLKVLRVDKNQSANLVPVDYTINAMIACCYKTALEEKVKIYNLVSPKNTYRWIDWMDAHVRALVNSGKSSCQVFFIKDSLLFSIIYHVLQTVPAILADLFALITFHERRALNICLAFKSVADQVAPFMIREVDYEDENTRRLWEEMPEVDKETFPFDMRTIEWRSYLEDYTSGAAEHLLRWKIK